MFLDSICLCKLGPPLQENNLLPATSCWHPHSWVMLGQSKYVRVNCNVNEPTKAKNTKNKGFPLRSNKASRHEAEHAQTPSALRSAPSAIHLGPYCLITANFYCVKLRLRHYCDDGKRWTNHLRRGQLAIDELNWPQRCLKFSMVRKRRSTPLEHCHAMLQELSGVQWNCCTTAKHMFNTWLSGYLLSPEVARSRNLEYLSFYDLCLAYLERPQPPIKQKWH